MTKHRGLKNLLLGATIAAFTLGLTSMVGVPAAVAGSYDDFQAPRSIHLGTETRANNDPLQAPRQEDMQPPRS